MITLRPYQKDAVTATREAYRRGIRRAFISLPTGCHAAGTQVMRADGRSVAVEKVQPGDQLMGPDSRPRMVIDLRRGRQEMRRVVPVKGDSFICNLDHVLTLVRTAERAVPEFPCERRAGEWIDVSIREWETWADWRKHIHKLVRVAIDYPPRSDPRVDSWFVGAMLGDGHLARKDGVTISKPDAELVTAISGVAQARGLHVRSEGLTHHLVGKNRTNTLLTDLRADGLLSTSARERRIPHDYLYGSQVTRSELLAGLLDTDGHLQSNGWEYTTVSHGLAEDVARLARSLGLAAYIKRRLVTSNYAAEHVECWRVGISGNGSMLPLRLTRKRASERQQKKSVLRTGFHVEPLPEDDFYGFTVSDDGRYLLDDFTVTHNSGKTVVVADIVDSAVGKGRHILFLVHRDELMQQARDKFCSVRPDLCDSIGFVKGTVDEWDKPIVIASVQTLGRANRIQRLVDAERRFDIIFTDEGHHAAAAGYQRIYEALGALEDSPEAPFMIGVSATPQRADSKNLGETFQEVVYHRGILEMMQEGFLCELRGISVKLAAFDPNRLSVKGGDFAADEAGEALELADAPEHTVRAWLKHANDRKTIVFTPTIRLAEFMAERFQASGITARNISGESLEDRRRILAQFRAGDVQVVTNAMILTEGWDEPATDCIVIARPTKSEVFYKQMVGRGLRPYLDPVTGHAKKDCLILDTAGVIERLNLLSLPKLFGLGEEAPELDAEEVEEKVAELGVLGFMAEVQERRAREGRIVARQVDLFSRKNINWQMRQPGEWVLGMGDSGELLVKVGADNRWSVRRIYMVDGYHARQPCIETLEQGLSLGYAMGAAEDYARKNGTAKLIDKNASWRQKPMSQPQLEQFAKWKWDPNGLTRGEASDMITAEITRRRLRRLVKS